MKYFKMKNEIEELKRQNLISIKKSLKLERENEELKKEIERSKEEIKNLSEKTFVDNIKPPEPMPVVYGYPVGSIGKNGLTKEEIIGSKGLEKSIASILNGEEHKCTPECFGKHVIKAIQNDYDLINFTNTMSKHYFTQYWFEKLTKEYPWLKGLYIIDGKIYFSN